MADFDLQQELRAYLKQRPNEGDGPVLLCRDGAPNCGLAWEVDDTIHRDTADWCAERLGKSEAYWVCLQKGDGLQEAVLDSDQAQAVGRIQDPEKRYQLYMRFWEENRKNGVFFVCLEPGDRQRMLVFGAQRPFETLTRAMPTVDTAQPVYRFRGAQSVFQRARRFLLPTRTT